MAQSPESGGQKVEGRNDQLTLKESFRKNPSMILGLLRRFNLLIKLQSISEHLRDVLTLSQESTGKFNQLGKTINVENIDREVFSTLGYLSSVFREAGLDQPQLAYVHWKEPAAFPPIKTAIYLAYNAKGLLAYDLDAPEATIVIQYGAEDEFIPIENIEKIEFIDK